jgi:phosphoadenosine phosphosulfate reductase
MYFGIASVVISISAVQSSIRIAMSQTQALWTSPSPILSQTFLDHKLPALFERLRQIDSEYSNVRFASSMAAEDLVLIDAIAHTKSAIGVFTLNTLRLHAESVEMIETIRRHYGIAIEQFLPAEAAIQTYVSEFGENGFYDSVQAKERCCRIRKVLPLAQALQGCQAWVTGQRNGQAVTRAELTFKEHDRDRGIEKFNPLFDWTEAEVWSYLKARSVPIHPLHLKGYPSIGCEPCTRPIRQGENVRAGRWWWLQEQKKECGLHQT